MYIYSQGILRTFTCERRLNERKKKIMIKGIGTDMATDHAIFLLMSRCIIFFVNWVSLVMFEKSNPGTLPYMTQTPLSMLYVMAT